MFSLHSVARLWQDAQTRAILSGLLEKNSGNVRISPSLLSPRARISNYEYLLVGPDDGA